MKLTRKQVQILKFIFKPKTVREVMKKFNFEDLYALEITLLYKQQLLFAWEGNKLFEDTHIYATNEAIAVIEERQQIFLRSYIPIVISVIALVKSFDKEILFLLQQLMQLLK